MAGNSLRRIVNLNKGNHTTFSIGEGDNATNNKDYTVYRTTTDMSNILYFHLTGGDAENGYPAALYVKSIEVTLSAIMLFSSISCSIHGFFQQQ